MTTEAEARAAFDAALASEKQVQAHLDEVTRNLQAFQPHRDEPLFVKYPVALVRQQQALIAELHDAREKTHAAAIAQYER